MIGLSFVEHGPFQIVLSLSQQTRSGRTRIFLKLFSTIALYPLTNPPINEVLIVSDKPEFCEYQFFVTVVVSYWKKLHIKGCFFGKLSRSQYFDTNRVILLEYAVGNIFPFQEFMAHSMGIFFQAQFDSCLKILSANIHSLITLYDW